MTKTIYIINGPNLNLLGQREPEIYGTATLSDIEDACRIRASKHGLKIDFSQFNHEGDIVDKIQTAKGTADLIILNAAAYTHTSVAILDAMKSIGVPVIEVHLSQPASRESFRTTSYVAQGAFATIAGLGTSSYLFALDAAAEFLSAK